MNFVSLVNGYYRIFVDPNGNLVQKNAGRQSNDPDSKLMYFTVRSDLPAEFQTCNLEVNEQILEHTFTICINITDKHPNRSCCMKYGLKHF